MEDENDRLRQNDDLLIRGASESGPRARAWGSDTSAVPFHLHPRRDCSDSSPSV